MTIPRESPALPTPDAHLRLHAAMLRLDSFTGRELAGDAGVKVTTAQDLISDLRDANMIEVIGKEHAGGRGAPAYRYRLREGRREEILARLRQLRHLIPVTPGEDIRDNVPALAHLESTIEAIEDAGEDFGRRSAELERADRDVARIERAISGFASRPGGDTVANTARARLARLQRRLAKLRQPASPPIGAAERDDLVQSALRRVLRAVVSQGEATAGETARLLLAQSRIPTDDASLGAFASRPAFQREVAGFGTIMVNDADDRPYHVVGRATPPTYVPLTAFAADQEQWAVAHAPLAGARATRLRYATVTELAENQRPYREPRSAPDPAGRATRPDPGRLTGVATNQRPFGSALSALDGDMLRHAVPPCDAPVIVNGVRDRMPAVEVSLEPARPSLRNLLIPRQNVPAAINVGNAAVANHAISRES